MPESRGHTEYGGGPGDPQRFPDGSGKRLSPSDRRRLMVSVPADLPSNTEPRVQTVEDGQGVVRTGLFEPDVRKIERLRRDTNSYSDDGPDDLSEPVSTT